MKKEKIEEKTKESYYKLKAELNDARYEIRNGNYDAMQDEKRIEENLKELKEKYPEIKHNEICDRITQLEDKIKDAIVMNEREYNNIKKSYEIEIKELEKTAKELVA